MKFGKAHDPDSHSLSRRETAFEGLARAQRRRVVLNWGVLLLTPLLGALLSLLYVRLQPPVYQAIGQFRLDPGMSPWGGPMALSKWEFKDELRLLRSGQFRKRVALLLSKTPTTLGRKSTGFGPGGEDAGSGPVARKGGGAAAVAMDPDTRLFMVTSYDADPRVAAARVNATMHAAIEANLSLGLEHGNRYRLFAGPQVRELQQQIDRDQAAEDKLHSESILEIDNRPKTAAAVVLPAQLSPRQRRKLERHGPTQEYSLEVVPHAEDKTLKALDAASSAAELQLLKRETNLKYLRSLTPADQETLGTSMNQGKLEDLRARLADAEAGYDEGAVELGPNHPAMQAGAAAISSLRQQIQALSETGLTDAEVAVKLSRMTSAALKEAVTLERKRLLETQQRGSPLLDASLASHLSLMTNLRSNLFSAPIASALRAPVVDVIEMAAVPIAPDKVALTPAMLDGLLLGFPVGLVTVLLLRIAAFRRWSIVDIEEASQRPVVAMARQIGPLRPDEISQELRDATWNVWHALGFLVKREQGATILFTSANAGEGTTSIVRTFAKVLADQGHRVLLIDTNFYHPEVPRTLGLSGGLGLSHVMTNHATLSQAIQTTAGGRLAVLGAGPMPPDPAHMLQSVAMQELLQTARAAYAYVVLDSAACGGPHPILVSQRVDLAFLVARYGRVRPNQIRRARSRLARAGIPFGGVVINGAPARTLTGSAARTVYL